jgi:hypothetical protein
LHFQTAANSITRTRSCIDPHIDDRIDRIVLLVSTGWPGAAGVFSGAMQTQITETALGTRKSGKGRRKLGRKKRRMRSKIRHRKK